MGVVKLLYRIEEPDGPWLSASCRVTAPPRWLGRGTPASFAFLPVQESSFTRPGDADHIRIGWIKEVSILSPGTAPAEPLAKVTLFQPTEQPKPQPAKTAAARNPPVAAATPRVLHRTPKPNRDAIETAELRRRHEWLLDHGYEVALEDILDNYLGNSEWQPSG